MSRADPDGSLEEGDIVRLGTYRFEVLHTPGHSPGHISLFDRDTGILFGGDLVGDIVAWYTPASGGVTGYLESLAKIKACQPARHPALPRRRYQSIRPERSTR